MCSKECIGCSWSWRHRFSHLPFPAVLQDCCKTDLHRLWTRYKDLLLLLIYIILLNIFLSCCRSVKCTLAKEKEEIPSLKSFQHRRQTVISSAEKKTLRREGRGGLCLEIGSWKACRKAGWFAVALNDGCGTVSWSSSFSSVQNRKVTTWHIQQALQF